MRYFDKKAAFLLATLELERLNVKCKEGQRPEKNTVRVKQQQNDTNRLLLCILLCAIIPHILSHFSTLKGVVHCFFSRPDCVYGA